MRALPTETGVTRIPEHKEVEERTSPCPDGFEVSHEPAQILLRYYIIEEIVVDGADNHIEELVAHHQYGDYADRKGRLRTGGVMEEMSEEEAPDLPAEPRQNEKQRHEWGGKQ